MNNSISDKEANGRKEKFMKDYLKWTKLNKKEPDPIYPPELNISDRGDDYWEYRKGEELLLGHMEEEAKKKRIDLVKRMIKSYNKNKNKINDKPEKPELPQSEKRKRKLSDLHSRSSSWKGLEHFTNNNSNKP
jgi:hypothetical protein